MSVKSTAIKIAAENEGVVGIKLKSGEMLVTTLISSDNSVSSFGAPWVLLFPMLALMGENITLIPWLVASKSSQEFQVDLTETAICAFEVPEHIRDSYLNTTGQKKILVAPKGKILVSG